ncbi:hypothetical protein NMY22_g13248 [Coprinellus aureogranulatus]|nr:hypothetical protein NMY22_g13248 [Coprinellus aureogranulatus]
MAPKTRSHTAREKARVSVKERQRQRELHARRPPRASKPSLSKEDDRAMRIKQFGLRHSDAWLESVIKGSVHSLLPDTVPVAQLEQSLFPTQLFEKDLVNMKLSVKAVFSRYPPTPYVTRPATFFLELQVHVPPESGFDVQYTLSPKFVVDTYFGYEDDEQAPFWIEHRHTQTTFKTPRVDAVEIVRCSTALKWNEGNKDAHFSWCNAVTRGSLADVKADVIHYPPSAPPLPPPVKVAVKFVRGERVPLRDITHFFVD